MAVTIPCPDPVRLQSFSLGQIDETEAEKLERHLAECPRCVNALEGLAAEDELVACMRSQPTCSVETPVDQKLDQLMQRARELTPDSGKAEGIRRDEALSFLAAPQAPAEIGRLGPYGITGVLGKGGMGVVLAAEDPQLQRKVALKALWPSLASSESARKRFLREARAAATIGHENVVAIHQVGEDRGVPYLVMQFLEGENLESRLNRGPLPLRDLLRIGAGLAEGLAAAHAKGLVHRDVKPANIWLESSGMSGGVVSGKDKTGDHSPLTTHHSPTVKILDFGLAWSADGEQSLTAQGTVLGTPPYMAPEQARGEKVDFRSDLFSLGSVLYAMACGQAPFHGDTTYATLNQVTGSTPPPLEKMNPDLPGWLIDLIGRLHAKNPEDRPASASEVAGLLRQYLAEIESTGRLGDFKPEKPNRNSNGKRRRWWAAAALILLPVAGLGLTEATGMTNLRRWLQGEETPSPLAQGRIQEENRQPTLPSPEQKQTKQEKANPAGNQKPVPAKPEAKGPIVYPIALFPFQERGARDVAGKVTDLLFARLATRPELLLVDRADINTILSELQLNLSGAVKSSDANKVGQLTGAKILLSGSVTHVDKKYYLVAKIVGTETSRTAAASVEGRDSDVLGPLVDKLAEAIATTIAQKADKLVARAETPADRLASLKKKLGKGSRPKVWVQVAERHIGAARFDPAVQTEIMLFCKELGFGVIDPEEGSKGQADIFLTGEGISETASRQGNLVAVKARLEIKATFRKTAEVLAADRQTALAVDLTEQIAGKSALQEAAAIIAERLLPKLIEANK